jgi:TolB-like protein/tetratricopeptide (TPR) repeat protein
MSFHVQGRKEILDKSIAVLPFDNDGPASGNAAYINGYCTAVHSDLCKIKDLRVLTLQSTEQYRNQPESIPEIAKNLGVGYVLSARGQIINKRVRLTVYLTDASDKIIWSHPYDRQIEVVDDHIDIQSEIAQLVADELQATITPEAKALIEKVPTTSMTAYDYCLRGQEEVMRTLLSREYGSSVEQAAHYFKMAIEYDPAYASAYAGLAMVSYYNNTSYTLSGGLQYTADELRSRNLDSMNLYANKALELDDQIADAYYVKGYYEQERGNLAEAMEFMMQAIDIDPNNARAMIGASDILWSQYDFVGSLEMLQRASMLEGDPSMDMAIYLIIWVYWQMDLKEPAEHYLNEYVSASGDSLLYYTMKFYFEGQHGRFYEALPYAQAGYAFDTTDQDATLNLGRAYLDLGQYEQAYPYYTRYFSELENSGTMDVNDMNRIGYLLWKLGKKEEARHYFQDMIAQSKRHISMNTTLGRQGASYDIAGVYAFLGESDSAYHYLEMFSKTNYQLAYIIAMLQELDPLFEPIRHEQRFQQLLNQMEAKYQAEHERVRQWLEENRML